VWRRPFSWRGCLDSSRHADLGIQNQITEDLAITVLFTVISIARGYIFRRIFNWLTHRRQLSMTQIHRQLDMLEDRF
jgi:hypothetical protein